MTYEEFKRQAEKIGVNKRCIVERSETACDDVRLQYENGHWYMCQSIWHGSRCKDTLGYRYSWDVDSYDETKSIRYIKPYKKDHYNLEVGDILIETDSKKIKVLGVCGLVYHMSDRDNFEKFDDTYTAEELIAGGLVISEEEDPETITIAGHTYSKRQVERRLEGLEEVK